MGVVGASGYTGIELVRLLAGHPRAELAFVTSDRWGGEAVTARTGLGGHAGQLRYLANEAALEASAGCDVVFLATPAEVSVALAPRLLEAGRRVVDLSGGFRLRDVSAYPKHYTLEHPAPALLDQAVYGLPELFRARVSAARLVANPGCYATAAALGAAPLLASGLVEPGSLVLSAASGVTGAGRKASEEFSFAEVMDDFRAYRVLKHQHTPEIEQTLSTVSSQAVRVVFTPHLLPLKRGIVCTTVGRLRSGVKGQAVGEAFVRAYRNEPFVQVLGSPEQVQLKAVVGTNRCLVGFSTDGEHVVVVTAIDNLVKGAAGQAVQNLNLLWGLDETTALGALAVHHP